MRGVVEGISELRRELNSLDRVKKVVQHANIYGVLIGAKLAFIYKFAKCFKVSRFN
jgi:hypothetical protein